MVAILSTLTGHASLGSTVYSAHTGGSDNHGIVGRAIATEHGTLVEVFFEDNTSAMLYDWEVTEVSNLTRHVGSAMRDFERQSITVSFDEFLGDDDLPTTVEKRTFYGETANRLWNMRHNDWDAYFGLTPVI